MFILKPVSLSNIFETLPVNLERTGSSQWASVSTGSRLGWIKDETQKTQKLSRSFQMAKPTNRIEDILDKVKKHKPRTTGDQKRLSPVLG